MCIIIYKKANAILPSYDILKRCFYTNNDGAGFCYVNEKNNVIMEKGFFEFKEFYKRLLEIQNDKHLLIHMRIATGGKCNKENCHPFKIKRNLYFTHNGILDEHFIKANTKLSDTYIFNEVLKLYNLKMNHFKNSFFLDLLKSEIGTNNKMVFFTPKNYFIVNEKLGEWKDGVWFSNNSYKTNNRQLLLQGERELYDYYRLG